MDNYKRYTYGDLEVYHSKSISDEFTYMLLAVKTGSINDSIGKMGLSHFVEHMLFEGTENYTKDDMNNGLSIYGINDLNAFTSNDYIAAHASAYTKNASKLFDVIFELINQPNLPESEVELVKKIVLQEYYMGRDDLSSILFEDYLKELFYENKYTISPIGTENDIKSINIDDIRKYHKKYFNPYQQVLVVRSNLEWKDIKDIISQYYSERSMNKFYRLPKATFKLYGDDVTDKVRNFNQAGLIYSVPFNSKYIYEMGFINRVLSGGLWSKLVREIREKRGLTYSISSDTEQYGTNNIFSIYTTFGEKEKLDEIRKVIRDVLKEEITESELEIAKNEKRISMLKCNYTICGYSSTVLYRILLGRSTDFNEDIAGIDNLTIDNIESVRRKLRLYEGNFFVLVPDN